MILKLWKIQILFCSLFYDLFLRLISFNCSSEIDDGESTKGVFEDLMGENVLPRKEFIENRADKVVNLDI